MKFRRVGKARLRRAHRPDVCAELVGTRSVIGRAFARPVGFCPPRENPRFNFQTAQTVIASQRVGAKRHADVSRLPRNPGPASRGSRISLRSIRAIDLSAVAQRRHAIVQLTAVRFGSTISNMRGNSSISAISSASRIGLPLTLILPSGDRFRERRQLGDDFVERAARQREAGVRRRRPARPRHRSARSSPD